MKVVEGNRYHAPDERCSRNAGIFADIVLHLALYMSEYTGIQPIIGRIFHDVTTGPD